MTESIIAVLGVLAGSTLTHLFQRSNDARRRNEDRVDRARLAQTDAVVVLAGALVAYRRAQLTREWPRVEDPPGERGPVDDVRESRERTWSAYYSAALHFPADSAVLAKARDCRQKIRDIWDIGDRIEMQSAADLVLRQVDEMMTLARKELGWPDSHILVADLNDPELRRGPGL